MKGTLLACLLVASTAHGQGLPTAGERKAADVVSWVTVAAGMVGDSKASWDAEDRRKAFILQGVRVGVTAGSVFLIKKLVRSKRPCAPADCGSDDPNQNVPSGHMAMSLQTFGGPRLVFMIPIAGGTGFGRWGARKHDIVGILAGAAVGAATSRIR